MDAESTVTLRAGRLRLELSPLIGGSISAFEWIDDGPARPILRKCNSRHEKVLDAASFPLVPYVNRIRGGCFSFRGREVRLAPNMSGDPSPLHGQGWLSAWTVDDSSDRHAALSFRHEAGEWPWSYEARQVFALDEGGLSVTLSCRNVSDEPMPCGLGQHPYFPCGPQTRLDTSVTSAWTVDEQVLPVEKVPAEGRYDLNNRLVCGQGLDNGFGGWGGTARMSDPDWPYELRLSSADAHFFQLYSPPDGGIFVAEPVSHANAALNAPEEEWPELGMRVLEPGDEMSLAMRLDVIPA
ncbi:MAG: aldose 1-epimerase [Sphingomonadales bacterium]|nr:aldose 1-epimerase [Sphingomonadales bacterium]